MAVRIVTDSTSDFPKDTAQSLGVTVVAQNVHFGTETFKDNVTITPEDFYSMLGRGTELPKTSQASPGEFKEVYDELGADADGIVSVHVSSRISGTCNSGSPGRRADLGILPGRGGGLRAGLHGTRTGRRRSGRGRKPGSRA